MASNIAQNLAALAGRAEELYRELVTTNAKFDELRRYTHESIAEYKRLLERLSDKIERIERDRIRAETELLGRIQTLDARLQGLSEQALHAAAEKAARSMMEERLVSAVPAKKSPELEACQGRVSDDPEDCSED